MEGQLDASHVALGLVAAVGVVLAEIVAVDRAEREQEVVRLRLRRRRRWFDRLWSHSHWRRLGLGDHDLDPPVLGLPNPVCGRNEQVVLAAAGNGNATRGHALLNEFDLDGLSPLFGKSLVPRR